MEKPIRILQVLGSMDLGGAETMIMNYYRNIDNSKIQFDFLLHRKEKGAYDDEILKLGGKIFYVPSINPLHFYKYIKSLNAFFKEHSEYRIVHSHLNSLSVFVLNAAKKTCNVRIAHSHIAITPIKISSFFNKRQSISNNIKDIIHLLLRRSLKKSASHYFACGKQAGEWMFGKKLMKDVLIINNAIDISKFSYTPEKALVSKQSFNLENNFVIGHIGRFHDQKNHTFILKVFKELKKINDKSKLLLIGTGHLQSKIKEESQSLNISDHVLFLGARTDIPEVLLSIDIFLFPSLFEGLPVTLIEAQASGLKIFSSNNVAKEVEMTNLLEFISLENTPKEWAQIINKNSVYNRKKQEKALESYDIAYNAEKLKTFYLKNHQNN